MNAPPQCPRCGSPPLSPDAQFCQSCGAKLPPAAGVADPLVGEDLLGRYRIVRLLGEGSMGRVYLGEQRVGEVVRPVAIKVLASARGNDDYIVARFRREAATIASLEHPNIIRIYDYGEEHGRFFSVMEYVAGGSLADVIAQGRVEPRRAERIAWQIAGALDEAHRRGVVHRDLKPENVLLAGGGGADEIVKVVDFGIARRPPTAPDERVLTVSGAVLGTPAFMSPEQFMGETADGRADVYALGLVVYQMLSTRLPWNAHSVIEWAEVHMREPPVPLLAQPGCGDLPARYDAALAHALAKRPQDRTPSTLDFIRELTGASSPTSAGPPTAARTSRAYSPTLIGGPLSMPAPEFAASPAAPRTPTPWLGLAVLAVGCIVFGYALVRTLVHMRDHHPAAVVQPASPDADVPRDGALHASVPRDPAGSVRDAGARPDTGRSRADQTLHRGLEALQGAKLDHALDALEQIQSARGLDQGEVNRLRAGVEQLGTQEVRRLIDRHSCSHAQSLTRRLQRAGAGNGAVAAFTRSHCLPPT